MADSQQSVSERSNSSPGSSQGTIEELANLAAETSPMGKEREEFKKRYYSLCRSLSVDEETYNTAWELLCRIPSEDNKPEYEQIWSACALYIAGCRRGERGNGVSLSALLNQLKIKMVDFFDPLKSFIALLKLGAPYEEQLKLLEKKFVVITILFQKYERMFGDLLQSPSLSDRSSKSNRPSDPYLIFSFGWTLFLVAKGKLLADLPDLLNAFHLLLCVVNLLFVHAPANIRKVSLKEPPFVSDDNNDSNGKILTTLEYICDVNNAIYEDVKNVQDNLFVPYIQMLSKNPNNVLKYNPAKLPSEPALAKSKGLYLGGLLELANLEKNKVALDKDYLFMYLASGDFDERLFVDQLDQIGTPSKGVTSQTRSYYHLRSKSQPEAAEPFNILASPYKNAPMSVQKSPMSTTLATVSWLKTCLNSRDEGPSETLLKFFRACDRDVTHVIEERIKRLIALLPSQAETDEWGEKFRIDLGVKLYYRILEAMLKSEADRLHQHNFTTLLSHDTFHRSLLACCMEIIVFSYKMERLSFPFILERFEITAFDFCKIIESVVRHEQSFPRVVVRHLSNIEEKILESLAWEQGSPLLPLIQDKNNQQHVINQLLHAPAPSNATLSVLASPIPNSKSLRVPNPQNSQGLVSPVPKKSTSHSLELFFRKLFQLASVRTRDLCARLQIHKIYTQVWQAIVQVLTEQSHLMVNRHLDQIIMCSLYGVCRVNRMDISFRAIIEHYRLQPQAAAKIFREVNLENGQKGDVIAFYNNVYIPIMEKYLLQLPQDKENVESPEKKNLPPQSPTMKKDTLYLSPMRLRAHTPLPSAHSLIRMSYSFRDLGDSPGKELQQMNETLNSPKPRSSKPKRALFNDNNGTANGISSNNNNNNNTNTSGGPSNDFSGANNSTRVEETALKRKHDAIEDAAVVPSSRQKKTRE